MEILSYIASHIVDDVDVKNEHFFPYGEGYFSFLPSFSEKVSKFEKFKKMVLENGFLDNGQKAFYTTLFGKIQKVFWGFNKLVRHWKISRAKKSSIESDLYLNSLNNFPENQKTVIYQCNTLYEFRLTDIINIWNISLSRSINFSPTPSIPKNPFLNIAFDEGHLFHFYMCIRDNAKFAIPSLIEKFIKTNMNIILFRFQHYADLIQPMINNYIENTSTCILHLDIVNMLSFHKKQLRNRNISQNLSTTGEQLVITFLKPILKLHLISIYSCNPLHRKRYGDDAIQRLKNVFKTHPTLGRKIVSIRQRNAPIFIFAAGESDEDYMAAATDDEFDDEIDDISEEEINELSNQESSDED